MAELYRYAAFISYSSKDDAFARRLHQALEAYHIPVSLGAFDLLGADGKPNRIYPVFRDREELSAGALSDRIEGSLKLSSALIVVCSPHSAQSTWVQREIEQFVRLGRRDRIFAILADTAPLTDRVGADATASCFPPAFRASALYNRQALEPLAADARRGKDGFRNAWLKIVAGLVGVSPGQLIDRDRRRRFRRGAARVAAGAALIAAAAWTVGLIAANQWRGALREAAADAFGAGRMIEAAPLALGAAPPPGALMRFAPQEADDVLARAGATRIARTLGWMEDPGYVDLAANGAAGVAPARDSSLWFYDFAGGSERLDVSSAVLWALSGDGATLVIQGEDGVGEIMRAAEGWSPIDLGPGSLEGLVVSDDGSVAVAVASDGPHAYYTLVGEPTRHELAAEGLALEEMSLSPTGAVLTQCEGSCDYSRPRVLFDLARDGVRYDISDARWVRRTGAATHVVVQNADGDIVDYDFARSDVARVLGRFGETQTSAITDDSSTLILIEEGGAGWSIDLAGGAQARALGSFGELQRFELAGTVLAVQREDGVGLVVDLASAAPPRELGPLGDLEDMKLAANGAFLLTQDAELIWRSFDLSSGEVRELFESSEESEYADPTVSESSSVVVAWTNDEAYAFDLATGERQAYGPMTLPLIDSDCSILAGMYNYGPLAGEWDVADFSRSMAPVRLPSRGEFTDGDSKDLFGCRVLTVMSDDSEGPLRGAYFDLAQNGARHDLGRFEQIAFSGNGESLIPLEIHSAGDSQAIVYDTTRPVWTGARPRGAALAAAVCAASGDGIAPVPYRLRRPSEDDPTEMSDGDRAAYQALRGRPWNPCDWRGLLAIEDGRPEGLLQFWRLIQVRFGLPGARDYGCGEVNAAGSTTPRRLEACGLATPLAEMLQNEDGL